jgi:hypothetical protein
MEKVKPEKARPDIDAAVRGGDWSQPMDGEGLPQDGTIKQALYWKQIYTEILAMEEKVLVRIRELMLTQSEQARHEVELTFMRKLDYFQAVGSGADELRHQSHQRPDIDKPICMPDASTDVQPVTCTRLGVKRSATALAEPCPPPDYNSSLPLQNRTPTPGECLASVVKSGNRQLSNADRLHTREPLRQKVERETGVVVPSTKHRVEFTYRLA